MATQVMQAMARHQTRQTALLQKAEREWMSLIAETPAELSCIA